MKFLSLDAPLDFLRLPSILKKTTGRKRRKKGPKSELSPPLEYETGSLVVCADEGGRKRKGKKGRFCK